MTTNDIESGASSGKVTFSTSTADVVTSGDTDSIMKQKDDTTTTDQDKTNKNTPPPPILETNSSTSLDSFTTPPPCRQPSLHRVNSSRLSAISKKYDLNGDGVLDETEQAMRDMDHSNRGYLSNEVVYALLKEQVQLQRQLLNKKRLILVLFGVVVILALSNLGTAWAAAVLAKDTETTHNILVVKGTNEAVATDSYSHVYKLEPHAKRDATRLRSLQDEEVDVDDLTTITKSVVLEMMTKCNTGNAITLQRTLFEGNERHETVLSMPLCPQGTITQVSQHDFVMEFPTTGKQLQVTCGDDSILTTQCQVSGTALLLGMNMPCMQHEECEYGHCHFGYRVEGDPGRCTCNPTRSTNTGCGNDSGKTCVTENAIVRAQGISHARPTCFFPQMGDECNGNYDCLSANCVQPSISIESSSSAVSNALDPDLIPTATCGCNDFTSYGCSDGQTCTANMDGTYLCME